MSLSKDKVNECKMIFDLFDSTKEGRVKNALLDQMLKALGAYVPTSDLNDYIEDLGSSTTTYAQFLDFAAKNIIKSLNKQELNEAFAALDTGKKGILNAKDLKHALMVIGDGLSENEVDNLLNEYIGPDGNINYMKFVDAIAK